MAGYSAAKTSGKEKIWRPTALHQDREAKEDIGMRRLWKRVKTILTSRKDDEQYDSSRAPPALKRVWRRVMGKEQCARDSDAPVRARGGSSESEPAVSAMIQELAPTVLSTSAVVGEHVPITRCRSPESHSSSETVRRSPLSPAAQHLPGQPHRHEPRRSAPRRSQPAPPQSASSSLRKAMKFVEKRNKRPYYRRSPVPLQWVSGIESRLSQRGEEEEAKKTKVHTARCTSRRSDSVHRHLVRLASTSPRNVSLPRLWDSSPPLHDFTMIPLRENGSFPARFLRSRTTESGAVGQGDETDAAVPTHKSEPEDMVRRRTETESEGAVQVEIDNGYEVESDASDQEVWFDASEVAVIDGAY